MELIGKPYFIPVGNSWINLSYVSSIHVREDVGDVYITINRIKKAYRYDVCKELLEFVKNMYMIPMFVMEK